jgi:solute:Na+ symporter, SSS family
MSLQYFLLIIFCSLVGYLIFKVSKLVTTQEQYLVANRETMLFPLVATLVMTEFNPSTLIAFSGLGYQLGWWALWFPLIFLNGLLFYALIVAKKWKAFNGICVTEFFHSRYSKGIGIITSISLFTAMAGFSATYVKSLQMFFSPVWPLHNPWTLSAIITLICLVLTLRGGMKAIIKMDVLSFIAIIALLSCAFYFSWTYNKVENFSHWITSYNYPELNRPIDFKFIFSLILLTMFTYILAPWYGQKIFTAKSEKTAFVAAAFSAICVFCLYSIALATTSLLHTGNIVLDNPEQALPFMLHNILPVSLKLVGLSIFFLIGATTLCGVWSAMTSLLQVGIFRTNNTSSISTSRILNILSASCSYLLANTLVDNIFDKLILANIPVLALSFALLAGFYWRGATTLGAYVSIFVGLIWGVGCYLYFGETGNYTWYWAVYGVPFIFISGILGSKYDIWVVNRV